MKIETNGWVVGLLGTWVFIVGFLNFSAMGNLWDNLIAGIIIAIFGFGMVPSKPWQGWISGLLGIWLIIAAFIPGVQTGGGSELNEILTGIVISIAGYTAVLGKKKRNA